MRNLGILLCVVGASFGAGSAMAQSTTTKATPTPANSGTYMRLDTGASFTDDASGTIGNDLGTGGIAGVGLGYRFSPWLRSDVTLGYRGGYQLGGATGAGVNIASTDVSALTGMVNGYVDLGTYGRFTPYVGGGVGLSRNQMDDIQGSVGGAAFRVPGHDRVSFAWQAGAGAGVALTDNMTLDVGYRYEDLGVVKSDASGTLGGAALNTDSADGHLRAHEVQIGLRIQY